MLKILVFIFACLFSFNATAKPLINIKGNIELTNNPGEIDSYIATASGKDHMFKDKYWDRYLKIFCMKIRDLPGCNVTYIEKSKSRDYIGINVEVPSIVYFTADSVSMVDFNINGKFTKIVISDARTRIYEMYIDKKNVQSVFVKFAESKNFSHKMWRLVGELK